MTARNWCFTLNNYTPEEEESVQNLDCKFLVYGREVGEELTPHLQGTIGFKGNKRLSAVKGLIPRAHWEQTRDVTKSIQYCKKDGNVFEKGEVPMTKSQAAKKGVEERWALAKAGKFDQLPPEFIRAYMTCYTYGQGKVPNLTELEHEWWYGDTGTGKTRKAREEYPDAYIKEPSTAWWDGYDGQEVVIIDDFDKYQVKQGGDMKRWLDHYSFQAPYKGSMRMIRPRKIIVTSNYHPDEIWEDRQTREPILRRVHVVRFDRL